MAENYLANAKLEPGTVVIFGGEQEISMTRLHEDDRVAGVVSENPAYLMNSAQEGEFVTAIALQGRTKVKVAGLVRKGAMLVTSSKEGFACATSSPKIGTIIGKSLEDKTTPGEGLIEVVVGRV